MKQQTNESTLIFIALIMIALYPMMRYFFNSMRRTTKQIAADNEVAYATPATPKKRMNNRSKRILRPMFRMLIYKVFFVSP